MKRWHAFAAILFAVLIAADTARAQGSRHDGIVLGEQGRPVAGATIVVCAQPANVTVTPCTPLANLFTDATLTTPAPNPLTSDGLGNYHFYAAPGMYTVQIYGPGLNTYTTPDVILPANPSNAQFGSITATNAISALTLNLGGNLSVGGNASVAGTLTAGTLAANLAPSSNAALKPFVGDAVLWVSPSGSDANDGKSEGSAMLTVDHALCSLPGGNCSTNAVGSGTVYFFNGSAASSTTGCGVWLMGHNDPNYASPPPCWMTVAPSGGVGSIALIGVKASNNGPNAQLPRATLVAGSNADRNHPGIWLSSTNAAVYFANIAVGGYPGRGVVVGECSNNTRTTTCNSSSIFFYNVTTSADDVAGDGPAWDITGGSFWIRMIHCGGNGTDNVNPGTGDLAPAVLIDGRTNSGTGLVTIDDFQAAAGGIKVYAGTNGGGNIDINKVSDESQSGGEAAVWFATTNGADADANVEGTVSSIDVEDATVATPAVQVDPGVGDNSIFVSNVTGFVHNIVGSVVTSTEYPNNLGNDVESPRRYGQSGTVGGWSLGKRENLQREFGLADARFTNQVSQLSANWTATQYAGATTYTQSIADPSGGTGAAQASTNSASPQESIHFTAGSSGVSNVNLSVGEYLIGGFFSRSVTANGYSENSSTPAALSVTGAGFATSGGCDGDMVSGDGEWVWNRCIYKVTAIGTNPASVVFAANFDNTHTVQVFAPVLNYIAPGTLSDNEAYAYEHSLKSYDSTCAAGNACGIATQAVQVPGGVLSPAFTSTTANPARTGIFRLSDGDAIAWRNHANTADVTLSKNASDQLVAPPLASPTFFAPIVDSASGASGVTFRNSGSTVWTTNASASSLSFNFNAHLGETTMKLAPFGGQSYAGLLDNYGMAAGFVAVTESGGTMAFDAGLGNTFEVTLNANVSTTNLINAQPGQWLHFIICQPSTGGPFTFNWAANVRGGMTVGATAGKCSAQSFIFDGTSAFATSPGVANQ